MEPIFATYSFTDVHAVLTGPFAVIILGDGSGSADEGISFDPTEDANRMTTGADGSGFHTLMATRSGRLSVRLLKTSPANAALQVMFNAQRQSSVFWGRNAIAVANPVTGDALDAQGVAFSRQPPNAWAKDPNIIEWTFDAIRCSQTMGGAIINLA